MGALTWPQVSAAGAADDGATEAALDEVAGALAVDPHAATPSNDAMTALLVMRSFIALAFPLLGRPNLVTLSGLLRITLRPSPLSRQVSNVHALEGAGPRTGATVSRVAQSVARPRLRWRTAAGTPGVVRRKRPVGRA